MTSIARHRTPFNVPVRAIYSKTDSVVAWKACIDEDTAEIEYHEVEGEPWGPEVKRESLPARTQTT
jgi:hypothetical protein